MGFPDGLGSKESTCNAGDLGSIPGLGRSPGEGHSPVFLPRKSHGQRNLAGYCPWDLKVGSLFYSHTGVELDYWSIFEAKVAQSCLSLCDPTDSSPPTLLSLEFSRQEYWRIPFSRGSSKPRDQIRSPTLQADSLPTELPGKPQSSFASSGKNEQDTTLFSPHIPTTFPIP